MTPPRAPECPKHGTTWSRDCHTCDLIGYAAQDSIARAFASQPVPTPEPPAEPRRDPEMDYELRDRMLAVALPASVPVAVTPDLRDWIRHFDWCSAHPMGPIGPCDCGLVAALAGATSSPALDAERLRGWVEDMKDHECWDGDNFIARPFDTIAREYARLATPPTDDTPNREDDHERGDNELWPGEGD